MRRLISKWAIAWLASFSAVASGAMLQTDDFQSGTTEGWVEGFATPPIQTTGGPAGSGDAFLLLGTTGTPNIASFNSGTDWVGDYASLDAGSVTVDLMVPAGPPTPELEIRLVLFGPLDINQRWTSTLSTVVPNDGVWRNYEFSLAEEDLTRVAGLSNYADLIGNVVRIMLRHNSGLPSFGGTPISGSLGIDNVSLVANSPLLSADFDGDGDVDSADLDIWESSYGVDIGADADEDNDSDGADFLIWQREFTGELNPVSVGVAVPEPPTGAACIWGIVAFSIALRSRNKS